MKKYLETFLITIIFFPTFAFSFFCPGNFNQIDFGMTPDQIVQACGKPTKEETSLRENENVPQEWTYFVAQSVSQTGRQKTMEGTLKTSVTFDAAGRAMNISVNGIGVGSSTICGRTINLGDSRDTIKNACGQPAFINKQTPSAGTQQAQPIKVLEYQYLSATPPVTLIFENGKLIEKR